MGADVGAVVMTEMGAKPGASDLQPKLPQSADSGLPTHRPWLPYVTLSGTSVAVACERAVGPISAVRGTTVEQHLASHTPLPTIMPQVKYSGTMIGWFGRRVMTSVSRFRYAARREGAAFDG